MTRKIKSLNEFRTHNVSKEGKHPAYIYAKVGDEYVYVGITHASITNGMKNIPLEKNPNPQDRRIDHVLEKIISLDLGKESLGNYLVMIN